MALDSAKSSSARLVDRRRARVQTPGVGLRARNKVVPNNQNWYDKFTCVVLPSAEPVTEPNEAPAFRITPFGARILQGTSWGVISRLFIVESVQNLRAIGSVDILQSLVVAGQVRHAVGPRI